MSMKNPSNSEIIADQVHSAAVHLLRRLRRTDVVGSLNGPRLSALSVIVFGGPITLGSLADAEQVRPPTMTRIVNALEEQGLVAKTRDENDRRTILLSATMKGKRLLLEGRNRRISRLATQIDSLNMEEKAALRNAIGVLRKVLGTI